MDVRLKRVNGTICLSINDKIYPAMAFKSFRPNPVNISEFYKTGIRLFNVLSSGIICGLGVPYSKFGESWIGEEKYDFEPFDRQMDMFIKYAPKGYFAPMFQIDTRPWYLSEHPDAPNSFTHLSQIAGNEEFRRQASDYLKAMITHSEEKYGERIYGYFLLGGTTTEWFSELDYEAAHPFKEAAFRQWKNDTDAVLPAKEKLDKHGDTFLSKDEFDVYEARQFHATLISDLIIHFASEAQSILHHKKLLGIYFGYLFELGAPRLFNAGHLDYERIFLSDDFDMFSSPSSYAYRGQFDPSAFMVTQKTLDVHDKLYFNEFDHRTHTIPTMLDEPVEDANGNRLFKEIPGTESKCKNEEESLNLMYRDFLLCQQNGAAIWWFDMFDAWFRSKGMQKAIKDMYEINKDMLKKDMSSCAEIAVFAGGKSLYGVRKNSLIVNLSLNNMRQNLASIGAPYDVYSFSDCTIGTTDKLDKMEGYKLYIFLNAYDIPHEIFDRIRFRLLKEEKNVLWLYAPDYAQNLENSIERIKAITGMHIIEQSSSYGSFVYKDSCVTNNIAPPHFSIEDPSTTPLAYYSDGTVACAEKTTDKVRTIYCACPNPPSIFLRDMAEKSGCFLYSHEDKVYTYVNNTIIGVYNATDTDAKIRVLTDGRYVDVFKKEYFVAKGGILHLPLRPLRAYMLISLDE